jgi:hypothetical protein
MSSASPALLLSEPSDGLLGTASQGSQVGIGQQTALQWWLEPTQRGNFPLLCRMAIVSYETESGSYETETILTPAFMKLKLSPVSVS